MSDTHAQTVAYVRDTMIAQKAPPTSETGAIKWIRENLVSSWMNAILTILAIYVIWTAISHVFPWMWNGTWNATSLSNCREIFAASPVMLGWQADMLATATRAATALPQGSHAAELVQGFLAADPANATLAAYRELSHVLDGAGYAYPHEPSGACWAVLTDRWHQLVFGYYSKHAEYWRPILALGVFLVGLAPVLFPELPRKMVLWTMLVPFACYWLIWGGSIWYPLSILAGFVLGYYVYGFARSAVASAVAILAAVVVVIVYFWLVQGPLYGALSGAVPLALADVPSRDIGGFTLSVIIGLSAIMLSLPLGIVLALGRQSDMLLINKICVIFIEVIRGVPLIVWLFTAQLLLNYFLPPGTNFDLTLRVIIMVTFFSSAYIAEVIRGGLAALPKGQYEGADSLGLNYWQSMRLIVLPQALKISIPGIVNTFIGLFKDTTLVIFIGLYDPLGIAGAVRATTDWNGIYWELFIFIGLMFFIACFSMGRYSLYLERKLRREHL